MNAVNDNLFLKKVTVIACEEVRWVFVGFVKGLSFIPFLLDFPVQNKSYGALNETSRSVLLS